MYKQRPVITKQTSEDGNTYLRKVIGRVNRLRKMIGLRETTVLSGIQSKIDEVDEQIQKLQLIKSKWEFKKSSVFGEISEIRSEIKEYTDTIVGVMDNKVKPIFIIKEKKKPSRDGSYHYEYFIGIVRGRMRKGYRTKDKHYHFGNYKKCVQIIREEFGIQLPLRYDSSINKELHTHLENLMKEWWLRDLGK